MYYKNQLSLSIRFGVGTIALSCVLFIALSLFSYNQSDQTWFYVSSNDTFVMNVCGRIGAECAALLMYCFGGASFLIPLLLLMITGGIAIGLRMRDEWERVIAAVGMIAFGAITLTLYMTDYQQSPYPGGVVGLVGLRWIQALFSSVGAIIFLPISLTACAIIMTRFSYIPFVQYTMRGVAHIVFLMQKYHIFRSIGYAVRVVLYMVCVQLPLFVYRFVQALLNGSAFEDTGLMIPENNDLQSLFSDNIQEKSENKDIANAQVNNFNTDVEETDSFLHEQVLAEDEQAENYDMSINPNNMHVQKEIQKKVTYALPQVDIFIYDKKMRDDYDLEEELTARAHILQDKLERFGVSGEVVAIKRGPVVTLFEYQPDIDTKLSKIIALEDDLAMALQAMSIRILAPIPGKAVVGFEVANARRNDVLFSQLATTAEYKNFSGALPIVLGKGTIGEVVVVDLVRMPHLLIAGSTGSGKSVALNAILISLLCKLGPDDLKLILIDPKRLEFASFADIAHLLFPIVTAAHHVAPVLRWVVNEMESRYEKMALKGARNSNDYNNLMKKAGQETLPSIVVIIDELADLMLTAGRDIEDLITRITQMARAAGIHMIVATQRPSVDVITGLIKANFPSRISFRVASRVDSRTILDSMGADRLLGRGDMLFLDAATSQLRRIHGAYVSDEEINAVVSHIHAQRKVAYLNVQEELSAQGHGTETSCDPLYEEICLFLDEVDEVSISLVQRRFRIGYNRSARIIDILESQGLIMPQDGGKMRKVIR